MEILLSVGGQQFVFINLFIILLEPLEVFILSIEVIDHLFLELVPLHGPNVASLAEVNEVWRFKRDRVTLYPLPGYGKDQAFLLRG